MGCIWRKYHLTYAPQQQWHNARLPKCGASVHGPNICHMLANTAGKSWGGWWRNWFYILLHLVVSHGNAPLHSLPTKQTQADVIRTFKHLVSDQPFCLIFKYVQSHADETNKGCNCSLKEHIKLRWIVLQRRLSRLPTAPGSSSKILFRMNKYGLQWEGKRLQVPFGWNWSYLGAVLLLKSSLTKRGFSYPQILIQYGGLDTIGLSPAIPKHFAHSLPSKFLDGAAATQSFHSGRKMSEINALNEDKTMRIWNTLHNAETRVEFSTSTIQLKPSWTSWTMQKLFV